MIVNEENLEKLNVANWTQFIDIKLLRDFVQNEVPKRLDSLITIPLKKNSINTNNISLSRFYSFKNGYIFWIEFILKVENRIAEGTIEAFTLKSESSIKTLSINGNLYYS